MFFFFFFLIWHLSRSGKLKKYMPTVHALGNVLLSLQMIAVMALCSHAIVFYLAKRYQSQSNGRTFGNPCNQLRKTLLNCIEDDIWMEASLVGTEWKSRGLLLAEPIPVEVGLYWLCLKVRLPGAKHSNFVCVKVVKARMIDSAMPTYLRN